MAFILDLFLKFTVLVFVFKFAKLLTSNKNDIKIIGIIIITNLKVASPHAE